MSPACVSPSDPCVAAALDELKHLIAARYPEVQFDVFEGEDAEDFLARPGEAPSPSARVGNAQHVGS